MIADPLDIQKITAAVSSKNQSYLSQIEIFQTLPSTNTYLMETASKVSGRVCLAEAQTAGRGRQGKRWDSPNGLNIYFSLLWNLAAHPNLSLAVGVMTVKALECLGVKGLALKWPNDIYYQQRKLAGVLIETVSEAAIIGIGLNCYSSPHPERACLEEIIPITSRNDIVGILLDKLLSSLPVYLETGFGSFLTEYANYDMLLGKYIAIRGGAFELTGIAEGINAEGELNIRDQYGKSHVFRCGEVSVIVK